MTRPRLFVLLAVASHVAFEARAFSDADASRVITFAQQQLAASAALRSTTHYPKQTRADGTWMTVASDAPIEWTQGFFPGSLWHLFQATADPSLRSEADRWTRPLEIQKTNRQTHDLGFKLFNSFGRAWEQTRDPYYRSVLLTAAGSLASRYDARVGIIRCCDWNPAWRSPLVIDTMMNLELLLWGAQNGGDPGWRDQAVSHALKTLQDLVRADGSTFQVADYDPTTGAMRSRGTFQGYSDASTWARGQAWAIYGFTMVYRYTRDPRMLQAARRTADWYLAHLPADAVPNWDFDAPENLKDSSTAAIVASALLELSAFVEDPVARQGYRDSALRMLDALSSTAYLARGTNARSILLHGVGNRPAGDGVDVGLIYGDYYFVEAVLRFNPRPPPVADPSRYSRFAFAASVHSLGTTNRGQMTIEFDVTPSQPNIDAVIGYADSATTVSAYDRLSMLVRLNPSGSFDVRNGGAYAALRTVPYSPGRTYHVRISADLPARRYNVWVRPPGAAEVQIASGFAFRTAAPPMDDLGRVSWKSGFIDNELRIDHHTVNGALLPVPPPPPPPLPVPPSTTGWSAKLAFSAAVHSLGSGNTGTRTIEFDVTPLRTQVDGVVGYADSGTSVTAYSSLAILVRMNPNGFFDARNGGAYAALTALRYSANTTYHVRVVANPMTRRYSVWIRPPGAAEIQIARDYAFRSDAPPMDDIGKVAVKAGIAEDEFKVERHAVASATVIPPTNTTNTPPPPNASAAGDIDATGGCGTTGGDAGGVTLAFIVGAVMLLGLGTRRPTVRGRVYLCSETTLRSALAASSGSTELIAMPLPSSKPAAVASRGSTSMCQRK